MTQSSRLGAFQDNLQMIIFLCQRKHMLLPLINPIVLRKATTPLSFSPSECKGTKTIRRRYGHMRGYDGFIVVVVVALLLYVRGKHLRSCRDGQLT